MKTLMIAWKHLRQGKGKNFQAYTQEFKRKALSLGNPLHTLESLLKYIGGTHSYLCHTILMFNPTNIDEVSIHTTYLEANKGKHVFEDVSEKPHGFKNHSKGKGKSKKITTMKKDEEKKPTSSHYEKKGNDEKHCWKLHPKLKPKWAQPRKSKKKATTIV
jgi:hypothetical protein